MELRELRPLRTMREEVEALRGSVESMRSVVSSLDSGRVGSVSGSHTLGKKMFYMPKFFITVYRATFMITDKHFSTLSPGSLEQQLSRHDDMMSVHDIRLAEMDLKLQVLETASFNGTLIWKIRDYKRRKQEAVASKTLSLYSQPFYTGYFGYKMCARVYLNGDGMGKGTHLSLFFVVMRGEYDALLPWPFKQKVTLMLMDQGPTRKHLGDAFKPDPHSSSFRRPTGEMNIASGCPLFVAQTVLENGTYIKDDTIFIKVTVDTSDLPDP